MLVDFGSFHGEFDHISRFCESQKYKTPANLQKVNTHNDRSVDKLGRDIKRLDGREICNNFNFGVCSQKTCKFVHACVSCKGRDHNIKTCKNNKGDQHNPKDKRETIPRHKWLETFVNSPINVNRLEFELINHPDRQFVN